MAEDIEQRAAKFYQQASDMASDEESKKFFLEMAEMEAGHCSRFAEMRKNLTEKEKEAQVYDPENQAGLYLQQMADCHGKEGLKDSGEMLTGQESSREVIEIALNAEKDSVVFYFGLRSYACDQENKDQIESIIHEELAHITYLQKQLLSLS
jgi:rubrerythrin